ncbi:hypothetical protein [Leptospira stimsonii]|nr:hypothetical protein [Leptospira stimsonii]
MPAGYGRVLQENEKELRSYNYEILNKGQYEKSLNFPKIKFYILRNQEKVKEILEDENNGFSEQNSLNEFKDTLSPKSLVIMVISENINQRIESASINGEEAVSSIGFQYDQMKIKSTTGGFPGRGQFSVEREEIIPISKMDEIKSKIKYKGYGSANVELLQSNRYLIAFANGVETIQKNSVLIVYFSDKSRIILFL